uniref:HAT C-terminal dimerisation domain-containing protein n=1 Tax=Ditylenchus dipsaci TaxID=166011 RepID=A0A915DJT9_9BILA
MHLPDKKFNVEYDKIYGLALFLDPRFKDRIATKKVEFHAKLVSWIKEEYALDDIQMVDEPAESPQVDKSWIQLALNRLKSSVGMDPLKIQDLPIAMLAMEVLAIPATSASIERIFSQAGLATSKQRNRTEFELLNSQIFVYCNLYVDDL